MPSRCWSHDKISLHPFSTNVKKGGGGGGEKRKGGRVILTQYILEKRKEKSTCRDPNIKLFPRSDTLGTQ